MELENIKIGQKYIFKMDKKNKSSNGMLIDNEGATVTIKTVGYETIITKEFGSEPIFINEIFPIKRKDWDD